MHLDLATISGTVVAVVVLMGAIAAGIAWFYRRGRDEQSLTASIDKNTLATEGLASQVGNLQLTLERHAEKLEEHGGELIEHKWRLKALEDRTVEVRVH